MGGSFSVKSVLPALFPDDPALAKPRRRAFPRSAASIGTALARTALCPRTRASFADIIASGVKLGDIQRTQIMHATKALPPHIDVAGSNFLASDALYKSNTDGCGSPRVQYPQNAHAYGEKHDCEITTIYFLDFETVQLAVPEYAGTKPYAQVPFQYSRKTVIASVPL